jgi:hypothetical protein
MFIEVDMQFLHLFFLIFARDTFFWERNQHFINSPWIVQYKQGHGRKSGSSPTRAALASYITHSARSLSTLLQDIKT